VAGPLHAIYRPRHLPRRPGIIDGRLAAIQAREATILTLFFAAVCGLIATYLLFRWWDNLRNTFLAWLGLSFVLLAASFVLMVTPWRAGATAVQVAAVGSFLLSVISVVLTTRARIQEYQAGRAEREAALAEMLLTTSKAEVKARDSAAGDGDA